MIEVDKIEYTGNPSDWYSIWDEENKEWIDFEVIWYYGKSSANISKMGY